MGMTKREKCGSRELNLKRVLALGTEVFHEQNVFTRAPLSATCRHHKCSTFCPIFWTQSLVGFTPSVAEGNDSLSFRRSSSEFSASVLGRVLP